MADAQVDTSTPSAQYHAYPHPPATGTDSPPSYPGDSGAVAAVNAAAGPSPEHEGQQNDGELQLHHRLSIGSHPSSVSTVNENLDVASVTSSIEDRLTWRGRMQVTLHSHTFHWFIIALVVLDALIVLFELLLDLGAFSNIDCEGEGIVEQAEFCHFSSSFRSKCGPPAILLLEEKNISAGVPGEEGRALGDTGLCSCEFSEGQRTCLLDDEHSGVNPSLVLHGISLTILSIFMIEIGFKIIAFRLKYFLPSIHYIRGHKLYFITFEMFDGMVVVISWVLDIASLQEEEAFELIDLVIILRLWRIVRVVNGAVLSAKAQLDQQLQESRHHTRHIITALHKAQDKIDLLEKDNQIFRQRLIHESGKPPPPPEIVVESADEQRTQKHEPTREE